MGRNDASPFLILNSHSVCPILSCHVWLAMNSGPFPAFRNTGNSSEVLPQGQNAVAPSNNFRRITQCLGSSEKGELRMALSTFYALALISQEFYEGGNTIPIYSWGS